MGSSGWRQGGTGIQWHCESYKTCEKLLPNACLPRACRMSPPGSAGDARAGGVICSGNARIPQEKEHAVNSEPLYFSPQSRTQGHPEGALALARARRASHPRRSSALRLATPFLSSPLLLPSGLSLLRPAPGTMSCMRAEASRTGSVTHRKRRQQSKEAKKQAPL